MISLEKPQRKWASSRLEGKTSWIFSSCGRCSLLATGTSGTRSDGLRKGQSPCKFLGGLSGFLSRRCRGLKPCVESGPELEDSSPPGPLHLLSPLPGIPFLLFSQQRLPIILPQLHSPLQKPFLTLLSLSVTHFGYELLSLKKEFYLSLPQSIVPEDCPKQTF